MKYTLLQVVQSYLNRTSGFYVDSIHDTDESLQVAEIAREVFYDIYSKYRNLEFSTKVRTLDAVSDTSRPNYLRIPDNVQRLQGSKVYYDVRDKDDDELVNYKPLTYLTPEDFLSHMEKSIKSTDSDYLIVQDFNRTRFPVKTDKQPDYYTSFDGEYIVFDSYDSDEDSSMQESKSRIVSTEFPVFLLENDTVIDLPQHLHPLYRDLVLVECYESILQESPPPHVQRRANSGLLKLQQDSHRIGSAGRKPVNYARGRTNGNILRYYEER